jgi:hypothetical protein
MKPLTILVRRLRMALYGAGAAVFTGIITGSFLVELNTMMIGLGLMTSLLLFLVGIVVEMLEISLDAGGRDER